MRRCLHALVLVPLVCALALPVFAQESAHVTQKKMSLEQRVQQLEAREEIRELLNAYGRDFDKRDFKAYSKLFTTDGVWTGGAPGSKGYTGQDAIYEFVSKTYPPESFPGSFHIMSGMSIEILSDNTARAWSRFTYVVLGTDGKPQPFAAGHYEDDLVRVDGVWKFKIRRLFPAK